MAKQPMTLEDLAQMVARGFESMATKEDLQAIRKEMATKADLQMIVDDLDLIRADIRDIKGTLGPLSRTVTAQERELRDLRMRMVRVERKVGLAE